MDHTTTDGQAVYEAPAITTIGDVEQLTQGASTGTILDQTFPIGTPFGDLTFS